MKTMTAQELQTDTGKFFETLLAEGEIELSRDGQTFPLKIKREGHTADNPPDTSEFGKAFLDWNKSLTTEDRQAIFDHNMETNPRFRNYVEELEAEQKNGSPSRH